MHELFSDELGRLRWVVLIRLNQHGIENGPHKSSGILDAGVSFFFLLLSRSSVALLDEILEVLVVLLFHLLKALLSVSLDLSDSFFVVLLELTDISILIRKGDFGWCFHDLLLLG